MTRVIFKDVNKKEQPCNGIYEWSAEKDGHTISLYIGKVGIENGLFTRGTLKRGAEHLEKVTLSSHKNGHTLDTRFIVGTLLEFFIKNEYIVIWEHIDDNFKNESKHILDKKPFLQSKNTGIDKIFKLKQKKDYWKEKKNKTIIDLATTELFKLFEDRLNLINK